MTGRTAVVLLICVAASASFAALGLQADPALRPASAACINGSITFQTKDATAADTWIGPTEFDFSPWRHTKGPVSERFDIVSDDAELAACFSFIDTNTQFEVKFTCPDRFFRVRTRHEGQVISNVGATIFRVNLAESATSVPFTIDHLFGEHAIGHKAAHQGAYEVLKSESLVKLTQNYHYGVLFSINNNKVQNFHTKGLSYIRFTDDTCARGTPPGAGRPA